MQTSKLGRMSRLSLLLLCAAVAFSGCSPKKSEDSAEKLGDFKVALITPGPISDAGWNAMAFEGLRAIEQELDATVSNQEAKGAQIRDALRSYAQKDYKLVFGHGFEYNEPAVEVAKDFPETVFISSSGGETAPNAGAFRFYLEQGFYLCGYMAGLMSESGVVAMVGGDDVPSIRSTFKGFRAGAMAANPDIQVREVFTGNGTDSAAAKQATLQAIAAGADFVIHQANNAAQGVFGACREKGVFAFGANLDQNANESGIVIASAVINAKPAFLELAKEVKAGRYVGKISLMGMDVGAIGFVPNPVLADKVPAEVKAKLQQVEADIKSGKLTVPKDEF
jgi:basic membrane lipoprotein Med (substrate-binding protein (PBP1-ABC) superfamily)